MTGIVHHTWQGMKGMLGLRPAPAMGSVAEARRSLEPAYAGINANDARRMHTLLAKHKWERIIFCLRDRAAVCERMAFAELPMLNRFGEEYARERTTTFLDMAVQAHTDAAFITYRVLQLPKHAHMMLCDGWEFMYCDYRPQIMSGYWHVRIEKASQDLGVLRSDMFAIAERQIPVPALDADVLRAMQHTLHQRYVEPVMGMAHANTQPQPSGVANTAATAGIWQAFRNRFKTA